ncbi:amino acid adenylation domain-containing protein, partial [Virgibacillus salarius]|uniref:amino acid adenylation domain-containing protein n=3 Tax=Virgibacillus TaxID=84406 RepID=UPI0031E0A8B7
FTEGYHQVSQEKEIAFQKKTNSFQEWGMYLEQQAQGNLLQEELDYWAKIDQADIKLLPVDFNYSEESNKLKNNNCIEILLSQEETLKLLQNTNKAYNTEVNDILLTALGLAIHDWTSENKLMINLEGHGREMLEGDINISRTIGWFTTHYPVLLEVDKEKTLDYTIKNIKETLRHIPNKGIGYGICRYLLDEKRVNGKATPQISFNYLGQFDEKIKNDVFSLSNLSGGEPISPNAENLFDIDINGSIIERQLGFTFTYNSKKYYESTMKMVAASYKSYLLQIIEHCQKQTTTELTPSDYADQSLTLEELEELTKYYHSATIQDIYPLTPMQEGMLFHSLLDEHSTTYFEQKSFISKGNVHLDILEQSFIKLIERYEILRSVIVHENVQSPKQVILKTRKPMIHYEDLSTLSENERTAYVEKFEVADRQKGFSLSQDILIRLAVLKLNAEEYKMIWSSHHILMDGWCNGLIMKDFFTIYSYLSNGTAVQLPDTTPYVEYIKWLQKQPKNKAKQFWQQYVEGYTNQAKLPSKEKRSEAFTKERLEFTIDPKMTEALKRISKHHQVTLNNVIQTVWGILLQKNTNLDDVVFGSVVSGRNAEVEGIEEMVGLFINTVPVRVKQEVNHTFIDVVKQMQKDSLESARYDYYPLADIQSLSEVKRNLVNHIIVFQNYYVDHELMSFDHSLGFELENITYYEENNYELAAMVIPSDTLTVRFSYNSNAYDQEMVNRLKNHFIEIIQSVIQNQEIPVSQISMTTDKERKEILHDFNDTSVTYPKDKTISQLWEEQVEKHPHHIAVEYEGKQLTYQALNEKANQLARTLRQNGITANAIVGIMIDGSLEMMVGMIGILKAGGAYLPIDPTHPIDRINYMIEDAKLDVLVTTSSYANKTAFAGMIVNLADSSAYQADSTNLDINHESRDLAYVMYTSGTTGKAKGVMVSHANLINYTVAMIQKINLTSTDETALLSSYAFDLGYTTIYTALLSGITLHIASESTYKDPNKLVSFIGKHCTYVKMTPSLFSVMMQSDELDTFLQTGKLRLLILGGEPLNRNDLTHFFAKDTENKICFMNHYGPTETTIGCMATEIDRQEMIEHGVMNIIGKPLANVKAYMLDPQQNLCPIGVKGELYVSGVGVAQGYLHNRELTEAKFLDNPFEPGERMYRTGDLARFLPDGRIEFLGRIDNQVKIRGYRVELGEIEHQLRKQPQVSEATVFVKDEADEKLLVAYFVGEQELDIASIRDGMKEGLPHYMIPTYFVQVEKMPLTRNGKLNKYALPEPAEQHLVTNDYVAPRTSTERTLAVIWSEVLGIDKVGIHDNFFDLGGDSIKAIRIVSGVQKHGFKLAMNELFKNGTIHSIREQLISFESKVSQEEVIGEAPLIPIQKMFFEHNFTD